MGIFQTTVAPARCPPQGRHATGTGLRWRSEDEAEPVAGEGPDFLSRPLFDSKTSQSGENSTQSSSPETHRKSEPNISEQSSQDSQNNPSLFKEATMELSATLAGQTVIDLARVTSNKVSELLSIYLIFQIYFLIFRFK